MSLSSSSSDFGDLKCSNSRINARFDDFDYHVMNSLVVDDHHVTLAVQSVQDGPLTSWPKLSGSPVQIGILHPNHSHAIESPFRNLALLSFAKFSQSGSPGNPDWNRKPSPWDCMSEIDPIWMFIKTPSNSDLAIIYMNSIWPRPIWITLIFPLPMIINRPDKIVNISILTAVLNLLFYFKNIR